MDDRPVQVIDLTVSFTRADHTALSNVVIELDDSLNEPNSSNLPRAVTVQQEKKSKTARKKKERAQQLTNKASIELIRERSPLGNYVGDCPICLERIGTKPLASTKCGHVFCQQCLTQALQLEKKCPTCRQSLRGKAAYHPLFLNRG